MIYDELRQEKIEKYAQQLRNNEPVKRFAIYPYRNELRNILSDDEEALRELEFYIESVQETL